jgi:tetratricopeptide (TPR) repeat protein
MPRLKQFHGTGWLLWAALGVACAGPSGPPAPPYPSLAEAPVELDFLLAQEAEMDGDLEAAQVAYARALTKDPEAVILLKRLAELAARLEQVTDALVYGERALALAPDDLGVRLFLGALYRYRGDVDSAVRVLRDENGDPIHPDAALILFGALTQAERYGEAREVAEWIVAEEPEGVRGVLALADVVERSGDPAGAEAVLREGLERLPGEPAFYGALAGSRRERGDRVGEIGIYNEVLELYPGDHPTLLLKAEAERVLGREDDARATLEEIETRHPKDLRTVVRIGFIDYEAGNFAAAEERFARVLAAQPTQLEVAYFLGVVQRRMGQGEQARATFERIPIGEERYVDARVQIAGIDESEGDYAAALAEVEAARLLAPDNRPLDLYRASLQAKSGDVDGALAFLEGLLEQNPQDAEVVYNIGVIQGEARNVDQAIHSMQIVLGLNPDHAGALNYLGYSWAERGVNLEEAEALIERALQLRPDDGYITDSLGWVYYMRARPLLEQGRLDEARAWLDRAIEQLHRAAELTGGDPLIAEHLGDAYLLMDNKPQALNMYEDAVRQGLRQDEQPDLLQKLDRLRRELGLP